MRETITVAVLLAAIAMMASVAVHAQDSNAMARCAEVDDADARLACYDKAARRSAPPQAASETAATASIEPPPPKEPQPLTEEVGEEQLDGRSRPEREPESFRGKVIDCKQDASKKWYFYFDNGQVWKQRANARMTRRDCDFDVTITKDSFGYRMQIVGESKKIRVGRIR